MIRIQAARRTMSTTMAALGGLLLGAGGAAAETFTTPGTHTFTVPAGATSIHVKAIGANGGGCYAALGGRGATVTAILPVTGGEQLRVVVGGEGEGGGVCPASGGGAGGAGGGGHGGAGTLGGSATGGGGGGGASLVGRGALNLSGMLVVAGGGGGAAYRQPGGNAGFPGGAGSPGADGGTPGSGGKAGTQAAGGAAGVANGSDSTSGSAGAALIGGAAGNGSSDAVPGINATSGGGGGGGGYYGGGGGGGGTTDSSAGAGGGGSSFLTGAATWTVPAKPSQQPAEVTITYPLPLPTATISSPGTGTSFTLGAPVSTTFSCAGVADSDLDTCADSTGTTGITAGSGRLDTSTLGPHTYTVTATTIDGRTGSRSIAYTVVPAAPGPGPGDGGGPGAPAFAFTSVKALKRQTLQLKLTAPAAGTLRIAISSGRKIACKAKRLSVAAGSRTVRVKLCAKATAALKKLSPKKKLKLSVRATYSAAGKSTTVRRTVKVPGTGRR